MSEGSGKNVINYARLEQAMKWFVGYVSANQDDAEISFDNGWLKETEGYKYEISDNAHRY